MNVVVTGGAGFVGSHLVEQLLRRGVGRVLVLDNLRRGNLRNLREALQDVEFVEGDIRDPDLVSRVMERADVVFHLAAESRVVAAEQDRDYCYSTNYIGTRNLLDAARSAGVRRIVFASSREVYGQAETLPVSENAALRPINFYGTTKLLAEQLCQTQASADLEINVVRLTNIYGPRDVGRVVATFIKNALDNAPIVVYGGDQVLDFIWIDSAIAALLNVGLLPIPLPPLNIGVGTGTPISSLIQKILEHTNSRTEVRYESARAIEVSKFVADIALARRFLNFSPPAEPLLHIEDVINHIRGTS